MNKRATVLAAIAAAAALGLLALQLPVLRESRLDPGATAPSATATPPAAPASAPVAQQEPPVEHVTESPDSEPAIDRILPRQSAARAAGLHRVDDRLNLGSSVALVVDANTREVLYNKNAQAVLPIASITKLMTGLVLVESGVPMNEQLVITEEDVDTERSSRSRLRVGTTLTRDEALHLALMSSENRAAHALGRTFPGGLDAFVKAMNAKARALGMTSTHYVDPTGLSEKNQSNARDLALLAVAASKYPVLREYSTDRDHLTAAGARTLKYNNSNRLVKDERWDIGLQKTGYIIEAGHCVVMRAAVAGRDLVMVLLDAGSNGTRSADAERLRTFLGGDPPRKVVARAKQAPREKQAKAKAKPTTERKTASAKSKAPAGNGKSTATAQRRDSSSDGKRVAVTLPGREQGAKHAERGRKAQGDDNG